MLYNLNNTINYMIPNSKSLKIGLQKKIKSSIYYKSWLFIWCNIIFILIFKFFINILWDHVAFGGLFKSHYIVKHLNFEFINVRW